MTRPTGKIVEAPLPAEALLQSYRARQAYTDCFAADLPRTVSLAELVEAFYRSPIFRPERWLLGALLGKGANNADVAALAADQVRNFAAWSVEARNADQILLCDFQSRTRSWLMVEPCPGGTRIYFGSAVVDTQHLAFRMLLWFHRLYARALLGGAVRGLI